MSTERVEQMRVVQNQALALYGEMPAEHVFGSVDHVLVAAKALDRQLDCEIRHVTLSLTGLNRSLSSLFVECLLALRGRDIELPDGRRRAVPVDAEYACRVLRDVFEAKNAAYGDSFGDHGAAGVVIRLLDQVSKVERADGDLKRATGLVHIANFAVMAMMLLVDNDPEFLS